LRFERGEDLSLKGSARRSGRMAARSRAISSSSRRRSRHATRAWRATRA